MAADLDDGAAGPKGARSLEQHDRLLTAEPARDPVGAVPDSPELRPRLVHDDGPPSRLAGGQDRGDRRTHGSPRCCLPARLRLPPGRPASSSGSGRCSLPWSCWRRCCVHRGYPLARDLVFVPRQPFTDASIGLGGTAPRAVPLDAVVSVATALLDGAVLARVALLLALALAGWGMLRLTAPLGTWARLAASGFAVWNPFVVERMALGQWALVTAYAALPWILLAAARYRRTGERGALASVVLWSALASLTPTGGLLALATSLTAGAGADATDLVARGHRGAAAAAVGGAVVRGRREHDGRPRRGGGVRARLRRRGQPGAGPARPGRDLGRPQRAGDAPLALRARHGGPRGARPRPRPASLVARSRATWRHAWPGSGSAASCSPCS